MKSPTKTTPRRKKVVGRTTKANGKKVKLPQPLAAIRNALEGMGWKIVLIGGTRVRGDIGLFNRFCFECDFTGVPPSADTLPKPKKQKV